MVDSNAGNFRRTQKNPKKILKWETSKIQNNPKVSIFYPTFWKQTIIFPLLSKKNHRENKTNLNQLSVQFSNIGNTQFDQSSPVHPFSESRGSPLSVTEEEEENKRKLFCLLKDIPNLGFDIPNWWWYTKMVIFFFCIL